MSNFFDNLLKASQSQQAAAVTPPGLPPKVDGALAGQTLLNMLQQKSMGASAPAPHHEESEADRHLKTMLYNSNMPKLNVKSSGKPPLSIHLHDALEGVNRDSSPFKTQPGTVLCGAYVSYEFDNSTLTGVPSSTTQICKIKNSCSPEQIRRIVATHSENQYLIYAIQPPAHQPNQGGKIRVLDQATGARALLTGHSGLVHDVLLCPWNPSLVVSLANDGIAILWSIDEDTSKKSPENDGATPEMLWKQICSIKSGREVFKAVAWHPSLPILGIARGPSIEIWDLGDVIAPDDGDDDEEELSPTIPPMFTNTPADPRLICLQGHREAVNTLCFSPDGNSICSGGDDGAVCVWSWNREEDKLSRMFSPDDGRPINVVHWPRASKFSIPSSDRLIFVQCDSHRNVQIWDVMGDTPCSRLDLPPGKNKITLQNMAVDSTASYIIVPFNGDELFGFFVIHVLRRPSPSSSNLTTGSANGSDDENVGLPELDPIGCRFDYVLPYTVPHLILSIDAVGSDESASSIRIFTVQRHAVQVIELNELQCPASISGRPESSRSPDAAQSLSSTPASLSNEDRNRSSVSFSREPPPPVSTMSPMGESVRPAFPMIKHVVKRQSAIQPVAASPTTPSSILHRSQSGSALSTRVSNETPKPRYPSTSRASSPANRYQGSEVDLNQVLLNHFDGLRSELAAERKARDKEEIRRTKQLLESVSKTINVVIPERVDQAIARVVNAAVDSKILPMLENAVSNVIQHHIRDLPNVLRQPLMDSFRESFEDQLLPAFRASFGTMFQQINGTLETGLRQQQESHAYASTSPNESLDSIIGLLRDIDRKVSQQRVPGGDAGAVTDPKPELTLLIEEGQIDEAFTKALNLGDANIVFWLCSQLQPSALHYTGPHHCTPPVLLSLAQQISFHLTESDNSVTMQLEWLREALLALSSRPRLDQIAAHLPAVISQIRTNINQRSSDFNVEQQTIARMVVFVITTLASK
uniref:Enhancer of mRNA-decapping protein 4 C-terminal domain-containing protein n=1 Tax=Spongospora subterranea TaxID=70186 RepID=A0A0H5R633_9EUKA|eukprot:CRZ09588.1 hypothetical protein [Spongospora subterranea]